MFHKIFKDKTTKMTLKGREVLESTRVSLGRSVYIEKAMGLDSRRPNNFIVRISSPSPAAWGFHGEN